MRKKRNKLAYYLQHCSVADPDPGSGAFLTPESGTRDGQKSGSVSGIRIWDEQPVLYF